MAANAKPQMKPIHIPTAPRCNGNAHNKPTDNPTTIQIIVEELMLPYMLQKRLSLALLHL